MTVKNNKIYFTKGDTGYIQVNVKVKKDCYTKPYTPHAGDTVVMTVRKNIGDDNFAIQKTANYGQVIKISPDDTKELSNGRYYYDIQLNTSTGDVFTVIGVTDFILQAEVTTQWNKN